MIKVSIIIPVYNAMKDLERCIESIINQTLQEIQIIIINDGSTDDSLSICEAYAKKDDRITLINKPNGGISSARNAGIEVAKGAYIGFVDSDDWVELEMFENMYLQVQEAQSEVCMCNYKIDINNKSISEVLDINQDLLQGEEIVQNLLIHMISTSDLNSKSGSIMASVWRMIVKKELIDKYKFRFNEKFAIMEDLVFSVELFTKCNVISINRGLYYHYVNNINSTTSIYKRDFLKLQQQIFDYLMIIFMKEKSFDLIEKKMNIRYVNMFISSITNEVHKNNHKSVLGKIKTINELCRDKKLKAILEGIDTSVINLRKRLVLFAMKKGLGIYLFTYYGLIIRLSRQQCR